MPTATTPERAVGLHSQVFQSAQALPWEDWYSVVPAENTLWNQSFFQGIEATASNNTRHFYVLIYELGRPIFCAYFQQLSFVTRQINHYTQDLKGNRSVSEWWNAQRSNLARRVVQLFRFRLLVNGNPLLTGETGFQALPSLSPSQVQALLFQAAEAVQAQIPRSIGTVIKDLYQADHTSSWGSVLEEKRFHRILPDPEMQIAIPSAWQSMEDYLGAMSSKYRQRAKSAYKKSKDILHRELSLSEIETYQDELFQLFQQVLTQEKFALCELRPDFLVQLKSHLAEQFLVHGYFEGDSLIGFTSQFKRKNGLLTHFIGYETSLNSSKKLYQRMLYDQVALALSLSGSTPFTLSLGRTAMEIKSSIGAAPQAVPCYLQLRPSWLNRLAGPILSKLTIEPWTPRHPFKEALPVA